MKNLSVGKKLGAGYGIVIALLVIILVVTTVTSLQRNAQLAAISNITGMQAEANALLNDVYDARIELRTVFTASEYEEEYSKAMASLDSARSRVDALDGYVANMSLEEGKTYADANVAIRSLLDNLDTALATITTNDAAMGQSIVNMVAATDAMGTASTDMVSIVEQLLLERMEDEPEQTHARLETALYPAVDLSESIDAMRIVSTEFIGAMDMSMVEDITAMADGVEADLTALQSVLTTSENKAAAAEVSEAVAAYRASLTEVLGYFEDSQNSIADARKVLEDLVSQLNGGSAAISASVNSSISTLVTTSSFVMILLTALVVISILLAISSALVITRSITRPLGMMQGIMKQAGEMGDLNFTEETRKEVLKAAEGKDEIAQSLKVFATFIDHVRYVGDCLEQVAAKDLTLDIELLSDRDTMGNALTLMLENLNKMFSEIRNVAVQVSSASGEIAQGAQTLAQGSTEQASTVQEISASIGEITAQSKGASDMAGQAAEYSQNIRRTAVEGNEKMTGMITSVQEINDASQAIGNVIKVIDDIAFQTNILALNAAVEAARAGEHGKGFAVVADEVRNLAGKSADAAKETAGLISANIEKASSGMEIAQETAVSLQQIVEGIEKTSDSLTEIARQSESNEIATGQVNMAVDQVAVVVQQNSATSEQSAAASEEMSSQAQTLQSLIAQFRLRDQGADGMPALLPQQTQDVAEPLSADADMIF